MHLSVAKESFMTTQAVAHSLITTHTCHDCMRKKVKSLSRVGLFATPRTVAYQAPPSMEFSRQDYWSGLPCPSSIVWEVNASCPRSWRLSNRIMLLTETSHPATAPAAKSLQSCPTLCDPVDGSPPGTPVPGVLQARTLRWVAVSFSKA